MTFLELKVTRYLLYETSGLCLFAPLPVICSVCEYIVDVNSGAYFRIYVLFLFLLAFSVIHMHKLISRKTHTKYLDVFLLSFTLVGTIPS